MLVHERIRQNLDEVQARIAGASGRGRAARAADVRLVAVTKKSSPEWCEPCWTAAFLISARITPQELWKKNEALADRPEAIRWHLIGHLQANKVKKTLPLVRMDSFCRLAQAAEARERVGPGARNNHRLFACR